MDSFTQREEGFERAFTQQEETRFKARARRDRKLGLWVGATLGLTGAALTEYASALVARGVAGADDDALVADLGKALLPHDVSQHRIRRRLAEFEAQAMAELQSGR